MVMLTGTALEAKLRPYGIELRTRAEWGGRPPDYRNSMPTPSPRFYDHHAAVEGADNDQEWRAHQAYHMDSKGWSDIAYNFGIPDPAPGNWVFEGRGVGVQGGHTQGENTESHAFCVLGNFEVDKPAAATLELAAKLMAAGIKEKWWNNTILGHRDAPGATTSCPGRYWYEKLPWLRTRVNQILAGTVPPPPTEDEDMAWYRRVQLEGHGAVRVVTGEGAVGGFPSATELAEFEAALKTAGYRTEKTLVFKERDEWDRYFGHLTNSLTEARLKAIELKLGIGTPPP